jgi:hypothetical protein
MEGFQVDELKLYLGSSIKIASGITLLQPTIGEIANYNEAEYFSMAQTLCATPSSMKVALDDMKLDYMKVEDFQLFMMLCQSFTPDKTKPLLGDLDLTKFKPYQLTDSEEVVLANGEVDENGRPIIINQIIYDILTTYIRKMHGFKKQVDKAGNAITRKVLIDEDRKAAQRNKDKPYKSFLVPLVSSLQGRQGYTKEYICNMGLYEFMNQMNRVQIIVQADAALGGMYSGFVDTKKMDKSILDWTRDITEETNKNNKTVLNEGAN